MKSGWTNRRLGEVCTKIGSGATPLGGEADYKQSGISLIRSLNVYDDGFRVDKLARIDEAQASKLAHVSVQLGDVLLNITGASVARCCLVPSQFLPARVNQHVSIVRPNPKVLDSAFLHYLLISGPSKLRLLQVGADGGSTRQAITKAQLQEFPIVFPESLPEQQRIVGILDKAFEAIATAKANAEKNLQNARALFESSLDSLFAPSAQGWVEKSVAQLVDDGVIAKPFDGNHGEIHPKKADYRPSGVPFIMACDLKDGHVDTFGCKFLSPGHAASLRVGFARDGDVLISHKGTIGRSAILSDNGDYVLLTPQVTAYRVRDYERLCNRFLRYVFMSPRFKSAFSQGAQDGSTRAYIGITKQLTLKICMPLLAEQKKVAASLDALNPATNRLATLYQRKLAALDDLKKSLLNHAFTGQL